MMELGGKISDKLRRLLKPGDPAWDPPRKVPSPSARAVRRARGKGLGEGANRNDHK
jgi:hypothetical protein